jgi:hypothetical protein
VFDLSVDSGALFPVVFVGSENDFVDRPKWCRRQRPPMAVGGAALILYRIATV